MALLLITLTKHFHKYTHVALPLVALRLVNDVPYMKSDIVHVDKRTSMKDRRN